MKYWESLCLFLIGKTIIVVGLCGITITIFYDKIARGIWQDWGWIQFLGFALSWLIFLAGIWVDRFLNKTIRRIIEE